MKNDLPVVEMVSVNWDIVKERTKSLGIFAHWIVGIIIATTISYILYTKFNKQIAALLVFMTTLMALYYYYVKWFVIGTDFKPPIGFCPDFMTNIGTLPATTGTNEIGIQVVCVDRVGISSTFKDDAAGNVNISQFNDVSRAATGNVVGTGGPSGFGYVISPDGNNIGNDTFCGNLKTAGLTWTGVCA